MAEILEKQVMAKEIVPQLGNFTITTSKGPLIEVYRPTLSVIVKTTDENERRQAQDSIERAGFREIYAQYTPSSFAREGITSYNAAYIKTKSGKDVPRITDVNSATFGDWLKEVALLEGKDAAMVLDTNIIMRHYMRNLLPREPLKNVPLRIPRIVLLEIERIYNSDSKEKEVQKRRLALYAARENIFLMTELGAQLLPELDKATLEAFSRIAGERFSDAWIRRETREYLSQYGGRGVRIFHPLLFATCDLMNALTASAENLGVLYFSRKEEKESYAYVDVTQVAELIIDLAISMGKVSIGPVTYEGLWQGKTIGQWETDCIRRF